MGGASEETLVLPSWRPLSPRALRSKPKFVQRVGGRRVGLGLLLPLDHPLRRRRVLRASGRPALGLGLRSDARAGGRDAGPEGDRGPTVRALAGEPNVRPHPYASATRRAPGFSSLRPEAGAMQPSRRIGPRQLPLGAGEPGARSSRAPRCLVTPVEVWMGWPLRRSTPAFAACADHHCSTLLCSPLLSSALLCSPLLQSTLLQSTPLHSTPLHSTPLHSTPRTGLCRGTRRSGISGESRAPFGTHARTKSHPSGAWTLSFGRNP